MSWVGVNPKGTVTHAETAILGSNFLQAVRDVDVSSRRAILSAQDDVLTRVAGRILRFGLRISEATMLTLFQPS